MQVHNAMTQIVEMTSPDETIRDAARRMAAIDAGLLPVADSERLVGVISDRLVGSTAELVDFRSNWRDNGSMLAEINRVRIDCGR